MVIATEKFSDISEIRVRCDKNLVVYTFGGRYVLDYIARREDIDYILKIATSRSLYAFEESVKSGFISFEGGIRIGLAGEAVLDNGKLRVIKNINAIVIRVAKSVQTLPIEVFPIIDNRRIVTLFREYTRYLCRTVSLYAQLECFFYYFGGFIVDYPLNLIFRRFNVTEGRECSQMLARITFCLKYGFDFLTAIFGVHFVENVFERCNIVIGIGFAVHLVVDCYKPNVGFGKIIFRVVAYKNVIPAEPGLSDCSRSSA